MQVRILGPLELEDGGQLAELGRPKQRALLALLAIHADHVVSADRAVEELWEGQPPDDAMAALHVQVSRLRRALGPAARRLERVGRGYVLHLGPDELDSVQAERWVREGGRLVAAGRPELAAERFEAALALWRGPVLADFAFAEFAQPERARLEELRLEAIEELAEARLTLGEHDVLLGPLEALVAQYPLRERLWAARILGLYRAGRQAEALRAYQALCKVLGEELGIEPSRALQDLEEAVLLQRRELDWQPPAVERHNLPAPRSSFVGREQEMAELDKLIEAGGLVAVVGPGGVGKTRLAIEVARHAARRYPGGTWLVELAPLADASLVVGTVAAAVGVAEEPGRPLLAVLADALRSRRLLLVLDNCEHLVEAVAALADAVLAAGPDVTILATSREPLRVEGETVWRAPSLEVPPEDDELGPEALARVDAVRLFCERARAQGNFALTPDNALAVAALCRRLDGAPLAIELAAARTRTLTPAQMLARLDDRFGLLRTGARTAPPRHQTLRAAVEWSHDLLNASERTLFRRLSVFAGGFSVEAAEAVCAGTGLESDQILELLSALVDRSLVIATESGGERRFALLETLRAFGVERLVEAGEERLFRDRHLAWAVQFAEPLIEAQGTSTFFPLARRVDADHENFRHALAWGLSTDPQASLRLVAALGGFWGNFGYHVEGRRWVERALAAASDGPPTVRALAQRRAAVLAESQGDLRSARPLLEQALEVFRAMGDSRNSAHLLRFLAGNAQEHLGDYRRTRSYLEETVVLYRDLGREAEVAQCRAALGLVSIQLGDAAGWHLLDEALAYNLCNPDDEQGPVWHCAGKAAMLQGDYERAHELFLRAQTRARVQQQSDNSHVFGSLGELALLEGDQVEAHSSFTAQLTLGRKRRTWCCIDGGLFGLAQVDLGHGDARSARLRLQESWRVARTRGRAVLPEDLETASRLLALEGRLEQAAHVLGAAQTLREAMGVALAPAYRPRHVGHVSDLAARLGPEVMTEACAQGRSLSAEEALATLTGQATPTTATRAGMG